MNNPTIEELVDAFQKAKAVIEEATAEKAMMQDAILDHLKMLKMDGVKTKTGYNVSRVVAKKYDKVSLAFAREVGATQTIEKIDPDKLRALAQKGIKIDGVTTIVYVKVAEGGDKA